MRIAVVTPYVKRILGNRLAFSVVRALATDHEVTVYVHTIFRPLIEPVSQLISPARLRFVHETRSPSFRRGQLVLRQLARGHDRSLARALRRDHDRAPFDGVVVIANEGHWLGQYVRKGFGPRPPRTVVCAMDLPDHMFLLARDRPLRLLRRALMGLYPGLHWIEAARLRAFDAVVVLSAWTAELLRYLYGIAPSASIAAVDVDFFRPPGSVLPAAPPYIAVPTVSLTEQLARLALALYHSGLPLVSFGPREVGDIPHRGPVSDAELVELLGRARATLVLFDYESLGLLPFESLAVGTPVVTCEKGGPYAELKGNPFVSFATSQESFAEACRARLGEEKRPERVEACRSTVLQYHPREAARAILSLLR